MPMSFSILVILFISCGKQRGELGEAEALRFHPAERFRKLALQNFGVGDEFGTPAAGGYRFEIGVEIDVLSERAADLVIGQQRLPGELFGNIRE
jgi:hypothetical protein